MSGPGAGDRGEMVAEQHPAGRRMVVVAVGAGVRRRRPAVVQDHDPRRDERAVVAVGDGEDPEDREDDVERPHAGILAYRLGSDSGPSSTRSLMASRDALAPPDRRPRPAQSAL